MSSAQPDTTLRVFQWNILAQSLSYHRADGGGFTHEGFNEDALEWIKKGEKVMSIILKDNPDIICLQEVDEHIDLEINLKSLGYRTCFIRKIDSLSLEVDDHSDGCLMAWKRNRLELVCDTGPEWFQIIKGYSNVAIITEFRDKLTGLNIVCGTTHLKASKTKEGELIRVEQVKEVIERLKNTRGGYCLRLLCLDANGCNIESERSGEPLCYKEITKHMKSTSVAVHGKEPVLTTFKQRGETVSIETIDYIFYMWGDWIPQDFTIPVVDAPIPNTEFPSDHLPLTATFTRPEVY